ncbi:MAG: hypothetical protein IKU52_05780 [Clostridia bacterium]|nr:hypothetical protein [Clostridia bacterium]
MERSNNKSISTIFQYLIALSVMVIILLCIGHIYYNTVILLAAFFVFFLIVLYSSLNAIAVPILLFFLPWSPLIKFSPDQMSLYTVAFFGICLIAFINNYNKINFNYIISAVLLFIITGFSKLINGYSIDKSYILFFIFLVLFPSLLSEIESKYDYYILTFLFSTGIVTAAFASKQLATYGSISRYIDVYYWEQMGITRYSGFYGDSNFYSAQITVALCGIMILLIQKQTKKRYITLVVSALLLIYSGLLGASKTFVIYTIIMFVLWFLYVLFMKNRFSSKVLLIVSCIVIAVFIAISGVFSDVLDVVFTRFGQGTDFQTLTTGRGDIWRMYIVVLLNDIKILFLGQGFTNTNVAGHASHNTIIQAVYQFGIVGLTFFILWVLSAFSVPIRSINFKKINFILLLILIVGCFGLWLSLDLLFFDELFLVSFYFVYSMIWCSQTKTNYIVGNKNEPDGENL